jgi:rhamnose transport system permease protein
MNDSVSNQPFGRIRVKEARHELVLLSLVLAEFAAFSFTARNFNSPENVVNIVRHSAEIGMLALAMMPVILTGGIDLSVGSLVGLSAVVFGELTHTFQIPTLPAAIATLILSSLSGTLNAWLITKRNLPPLIVTLGTLSLFRGLAEAITRGTKTYREFTPTFLQFSDLSHGGLPIQAVMLMGVSLAVFLAVHHTVAGVQIRACGFSPEGAIYAGSPSARRVSATYQFSGFIAGACALLLTSRLHQARADAGTGYELAAITAVVLGGSSIFGGKGNVLGTLLGIAAIALLSNGIGRIPVVLKMGVGNELASLLTGMLLLVALAAGNLHRLPVFRATKLSTPKKQKTPLP